MWLSEKFIVILSGKQSFELKTYNVVCWISQKNPSITKEFTYAKLVLSQYAWNFINFNPIHILIILKGRQQTEISIA